jgi:hypothetical protein
MQRSDRPSALDASRTRRRDRIALATVGVVVASTLLTAAPAGARTVPRQAAGTARAAVAAPSPGALPAQSKNQVYATQLARTVALSTAPATVSAIAAWLDAPGPIPALTFSLAHSVTALDPLVTSAYTHLVGTAPSTATRNNYVNGMRTGLLSFEQFAAQVTGTPAFLARYTTVHSRLDAISITLLGTHVTPAREVAWRQQLSHGMTLPRVTLGITRTLAYGNHIVATIFPRVLFRTVPLDSSGYWAHAVAAGTAGRVLLPGLLGASAEAQAFGCDPIAGTGTSCLLPWPNDYYTAPDASTGTGRRLALKPGFLPANNAGVHIDPIQLNRSDGFSPGSTITVQVPGIDLAQTGAATVADITPTTLTNAPIVLVDTATGVRQPVWAELDVHGPYPDPSLQPLLIHPTRNLLDGHHYVVALRNLKNAAGSVLPAPAVFAAYRDHGTSSAAGFAGRKPHMESIFTQLGAAGIARSNLYLAWDFTVASTANITGRMLSIRDDAFSKLGSASPAFTVTSNTPDGNTGMARVVKGTFTVPNYLTGDGSPGNTFNEGPDGLPRQNGTLTAPFDCIIPTSALTTPGRPSLYGHGLFGDETEVESGSQQSMSAGHDVVYCATKWAGMSQDDIGTAATILQDLSGFPKLADRVQQGVLNTLFLGRLMIVAGGLTSNAAFQNASHQSVIDTSHLYYDGNSQGGIMGGMATAVATDWTRAVLGVSGINYSLLLPRSTDFATFESIMTPAYPAELSRLLGLMAVQLEWDRAEPDGYANHITSDPLPGTPAHTVLMHIAFGDHQVSNVAADTEARTIGASTNCPSLAGGRSPGTFTLWNVPCIAAFPFAGSAIVYWDSGSDVAPLADVPPAGGHDPHEDPRRSPLAQQQKSDFLMPSGTVTDVCAGAPCTAAQT